MVVRERETLDTIRDVRVIQKRDGYRFSVDAVLLAEFVEEPKGEKGIELGGGCGIVSILLAKRFSEVRMTIVEVQGVLAELALRNISLNGLDGRLEVLCEGIEDLGELEESFDFVVTNPPYRKKGTGRINPVFEKAIARHELLVTLEQIVDVSAHLLKDDGQFFIIHIPARYEELLSLMTKKEINPERVLFVYPRPFSEAILVLIEGIKKGAGNLKVMEPLYISEGNFNGLHN